MSSVKRRVGDSSLVTRYSSLQWQTVLLVAVLAGGLGGGAAGRAQAETTNRILAVVNDDVITEGDLTAQLHAMLDEEDRRRADDGQTAQMRQAVLRRLIEERLLLQAAKSMEISVGSEEVLERLKEVQRDLGSPEAYAQMLQQAHLTEEQLKQKLREQLLLQKAVDQHVRSAIRVSPSELTRATSSAGDNAGTPRAEEVRAYHLLIRVTETRSAEHALELATHLSQQVLGGADFETVARRYSEDPNADQGGLLEWVRPGQLLPELDEALFRLQPGEVSAPIRTPLGYHVVKVIERRAFSPEQAAESRDQFEQRLYREKFTQAMTKWLDELKANAYIEIFDE